jgi:hypothetical protein
MLRTPICLVLTIKHFNYVSNKHHKTGKLNESPGFLGSAFYLSSVNQANVLTLFKNSYTLF